MRYQRVLSAASVMLIALTAACTGSDDELPDLVIGASLERTGSASALGLAYEQALQLQVEQINESGMLGHRRMRLIVRDNRTESATALSQVTAFSSDPDVTAIVTGACSECAITAARVVEEKGVPTITLAPASQLGSSADARRNLFKLGPNATDNANLLVGELSSSGVTTVATMNPDDAYGRDARDAIAVALRKTRIVQVASPEFRAGDTDLSAAARAVVQAAPAATVVIAFPTQASLAAGALRNAGYTGKIYFDASAAGELFLPPSGAADGTTMVFVPTLAVDDVIATTPAKAARRRWFEDYTSRYGMYQGQASFAADAARLIADAVVRAGTTDRDDVRTKLETVRTDGLSGPLRMTPNNHSALMPQALALLVVRNGRWRLLG